AVRAGRGDRLRPDRGDVAGRYPGSVPGRPGRPLAESDARFGESAVRRIVLASAIVLVAAAGIGYYLWANRVAAGPPPPPIPDGLTDPPARQVVQEKRQAVLAAPRSGTAWGELAMALNAHDASAEAVACYRRVRELDPNDARWAFLLALQLNGRATGDDKEEAVRLYRQAAACPA